VAVSDDRITIARRGFDAFNRGEVEELVALSHPDCEWLPFRAQLEGGAYRGHDGIREFARDMAEDWESFVVEMDETCQFGDNVLIVGRVRALARGSGVTVENRSGFVLEFDGDRIRRLVSFSDPDAARQAAQAG